jgi:hypothetical protein
MRGRHRRATGSCVTTVAGIVSRARVGTGSGDVRFCPVTSINRDRAAATEPSNGIRAGIQGSNCVGCLVEGGRARLTASVDTAASGTIISSSNYHLDPSSFLSFNSSSQFIASSATFRRRATPGVS